MKPFKLHQVSLSGDEAEVKNILETEPGMITSYTYLTMS